MLRSSKEKVKERSPTKRRRKENPSLWSMNVDKCSRTDTIYTGVFTDLISEAQCHFHLVSLQQIWFPPFLFNKPMQVQAGNKTHLSCKKHKIPGNPRRLLTFTYQTTHAISVACSMYIVCIMQMICMHWTHGWLTIFAKLCSKQGSSLFAILYPTKHLA